MNTKDFKAMISLLDDQDEEVVSLIENKLITLGSSVLPELVNEMKFYREKEAVLTKIESLIHSINNSSLESKFEKWFNDGGLDLFEGIFLTCLAVDENLKIEDLKREFNKIYLEVWTKSRSGINPLDLIGIINEVIFDYFGFEANTKNFHAPANTLFNEVLKDRKGNSVCLSSLYILIAEKLGVPIYGVNFPNLFILIYDDAPHTFYVNVFKRGQIFLKKDIEQFLKSMDIEPIESYYSACSNKDIIVRILNNLEYAYGKSGEITQLEKIRQIRRSIR